MRKNRSSVSNATIYDAFIAGAESDVVAVYMYCNDSGAGAGSARTSAAAAAAAGSHDDAAPTTVEYLDAAGLKHLLWVRDRPFGGLLQRFVPPRGTHNDMVRVVWSPMVQLIERSVNVNCINLPPGRPPGPADGLLARYATFDGPAIASRTAPVRGARRAVALQAACAGIVDHVRTVSFTRHTISRAVFHFKEDSTGTLWFLFASSVRTEGPALDAAAVAGAAPPPPAGVGASSSELPTQTPLAARHRHLVRPASARGPLKMDGGIAIPKFAR